MRSLNLKNKSIDFNKLLEYGFSKKDNYFFYEKNIFDGNFKVKVEISKENQISKLIDLSIDEEYILADVKDSSGEFVGKIKEEYENILNDIIEKCTLPNIFKSKQAQEIIKYNKEKYDVDLEYLWEQFPNDAVLRNKSNNKWYGVLFVLPERKLGIESDNIIDIIDLRYNKENIKNIVDNKKIFKGYHMNKDNWITIKLDESVKLSEIYKFIDNSYELSL